MKEHGFFNTLKVSCFDFKKYSIFLNMKGSRVIFNRIIFVLIISIFYIVSFTKIVGGFEEFNNNKETIFEDITFSNGVLNISNSPVIFKPSEFKGNEFLLIGDTRDDFNLKNYSDYDLYKKALVLTKDSIIFKNRLNEINLKYSDFNIITPGITEATITKDIFFNFIGNLTPVLKYMIYLILPMSKVIDYFLFAFITSLFAFICSIISRFRASFFQIFKIILFAQTMPYIVISIFDIISELNGVKVMFPVHILEFLTLLIFVISIYQVKKDIINKIQNK